MDIDSQIVEKMQEVRLALEALERIARGRHAPGPEDKADVRGLWYRDMPSLARTAADVMERAAALFPGAPFGPADLRGLEEEVRQTETLLVQAEASLKRVRGIYNAKRRRLCEWTCAVTAQVQGLEELPFLPEEQRELVREAAPQVRAAFLRRRGKKVVATPRELIQAPLRIDSRVLPGVKCEDRSQDGQDGNACVSARGGRVRRTPPRRLLLALSGHGMFRRQKRHTGSGSEVDPRRRRAARPPGQALRSAAGRKSIARRKACDENQWKRRQAQAAAHP